METTTGNTKPKNQGNESNSGAVEELLPVLDLAFLTEQAKREEEWTTKLYSKTILKNEELRIMLIGIHEKSEIEMHEAEATTSVQVLDGELMFVTNDDVAIIDKGELLTLNKGTYFGLKAKEPTIFLMTTAGGIK
jgi:quercetin dioxygenase-like cupin family protein